MKAVLLHPKCPAVKHSFPLPGLDFKRFPNSCKQQWISFRDIPAMRAQGQQKPDMNKGLGFLLCQGQCLSLLPPIHKCDSGLPPHHLPGQLVCHLGLFWGSFLSSQAFPQYHMDFFLPVPSQQSKSAIQITECGISALSLLSDGTGTGISTWAVCVHSGKSVDAKRGTLEHPFCSNCCLSSSRTFTKFLSAFPCIPCPFVASQNVWIFPVTLISVLISGLLL